MTVTATDVLIDAMGRLDAQRVSGIVVVLVSEPESDGISITCLSNIGDQISQVGALDMAKDAILHPPTE